LAVLPSSGEHNIGVKISLSSSFSALSPVLP
jgi:hypothetical protein